MKQSIGIGILGFAALTLVACSSTKLSGVSAGVADASSSSQGLGARTNFSAQDKGESYTVKAPHNQIYLFGYDTSSLKAKYMPSLEAQARYLVTHPGARIMLAGHTDNRGSREYNVALGERRGRSVADALRLAGVKKNQVRVVSYGKERPTAFGLDKESNRLNRRVELTYEAIR